MSDKSKIEWTDATWNPVTGCTKVSEGCRNCYAKTFTERFEGTPGHYFETGFRITLRPDKLNQPYHWKRPRRIFVNSMSDLFHNDIPDDYIWSIFEVMAKCPQHTFQVLTKRPERMVEMLNGRYWRNLGTEEKPFYARIAKGGHREGDVPYLPNVWIGVSVENQQAADERIPLLLETPAAVRFLSCEPLLGLVNLSKWLLTPGWSPSYYDPDNIHGYPNAEPTNDYINWVIVGGESGSKARPMHLDWARNLRDQCLSAGIPFFFKQWGEWMPVHPDRKPYEFSTPQNKCTEIDGMRFYKIGKKIAGRKLDGKEYNETPEEARTCQNK